ncbi:MAG: PRTRC system protein E [Bryobacterales bacterium]|nr:PRTRC system protein E [Bryobacterales bacterium]
MNTHNSIGFFAELLPMLNDRTIMMVVAKADDSHLTVSVVPKRIKDDESPALTTPLCCTGTPEELDRELPTQVREFVGGYVMLSGNLDEIRREREEAEKAAREDAKKKTKVVGNGGAKAKAPESTPKPEAPKQEPAMLSLFDAPSETPNGASATDAPIPPTDAKSS